MGTAAGVTRARRPAQVPTLPALPRQPGGARCQPPANERPPMRSSIRKSFALLVAGLGLSASVALADPKPSPPAKIDPKPPVGLPKVQPKQPMPLPKAPMPLPKFEPKPLPLPPKPIPLPPKVDPKPVPLPPKVDTRPLPLPKPDPVKPPLPRIDPRVTTPPFQPETRLPTRPDFHPPVVHVKPKAGGPVEMPKGPGLKLPPGTKVDQSELARIKPPVDLTRTRPEVVLGKKPPADFKVKPVKLDSIHVPADAPAVEKLSVTNIKNVTVNQQFVVNKSYYKGGDYHTKFGTKMGFGYCYPGKYHSHWHHCIWDPCFSCHYFYCPSACCYYYWCGTEHCYYPCHWFVTYGDCYYPWWICGGFGGYGYVAKPTC